jgi:predicted O-linked N-acetylglucosamine transferase (SPINDLY family)
LNDFVVHSPEEYMKLAVRFGTDPDLRAATRARVGEAFEKRHPLIKDAVSTTYANVIDQIVEREFPEFSVENAVATRLG